MRARYVTIPRVPAPVSVVIPSLNEQQRIGAAIDSAYAAGAAEVIVADGGSSDETIRAAESHRARIVLGQKMRARQLNRGAEAATQPSLIFLHADTLLPAGAAAAAHGALQHAAFGGFRLRFAERALKLHLAAAMINLRTAMTRCPWGDQAQFVRRDDFLRDGGFREIPIMEDYELATRMKSRGRPAILPLTVITSGRRFLDKGVLKTAAINWRIVIAYRMGTDPEELTKMYRG